MPDGGLISVRAAHALLPGGGVTLSVAGEGVGMDALTLELACDEFYTTKAQGAQRTSAQGMPSSSSLLYTAGVAAYGAAACRPACTRAEVHDLLPRSAPCRAGGRRRAAESATRRLPKIAPWKRGSRAFIDNELWRGQTTPDGLAANPPPKERRMSSNDRSDRVVSSQVAGEPMLSSRAELARCPKRLALGRPRPAPTL
jgi:hypothetical protein